MNHRLINSIQIPREAHSLKHWLLLISGLFVMALGVAFSIKADLGTSPISSVPYVLSVITPMSVGIATIVLHCVLIALQIIILRNRYRLFQLLQLPVAFVFGWMTDFAVSLTERVAYSNYFEQIILCAVGIILVGVGVWMEVHSKIITVAGEGFVLAMCQATPIKFGNMKVIFDASLVAISCVLGLTFAGGIYGVREGTVAAALCVGLITKLISHVFDQFENHRIGSNYASQH